MRQSGDQSQRWRRSRAGCSAGEALTSAALQIEQRGWMGSRALRGSLSLLLSLSLCLILFSLSLPHGCSGSSSLSPYLLLSILITLCCFIFLPPPTIPFFLYFCLVPTICHPLSSSVTPTLLPHSFSLPQSNSGSFIGIIRWILLSLPLFLEHLSSYY